MKYTAWQQAKHDHSQRVSEHDDPLDTAIAVIMNDLPKSATLYLEHMRLGVLANQLKLDKSQQR